MAKFVVAIDGKLLDKMRAAVGHMKGTTLKDLVGRACTEFLERHKFPEKEAKKLENWGKEVG